MIQTKQELTDIKEWARSSMSSHRKRGFDIMFNHNDLVHYALNNPHCYHCGQYVLFNTKRSDSTFSRATLDRLSDDPEMFLWNCVISCSSCNTKREHGFVESQMIFNKEIEVDEIDEYVERDYTELYKKIKTLSKKHREVVELFIFEGKSHAKIAEELQIPEGTARSRLHYALYNLK